jgi:hypothetical protein
MVLGGDHGVGAGAVGHPQARAQVVRVGHAVQHQQQRLGRAGFLQLLKQFIQRLDLGQHVDPGDHTLVAVAAAHLGQAQAVGFNQADAGLAGPVSELAHARIAA